MITILDTTKEKCCFLNSRFIPSSWRKYRLIGHVVTWYPYKDSNCHFGCLLRYCKMNEAIPTPRVSEYKSKDVSKEIY